MVQTHDIATVYNLERHGTFSKKNNGHIMVFWDIFLYNKLFLLHWNNRIIHLGFKPQIACVFGIIFDIIRLLGLILYDIEEYGAHTLGEKYKLSIRWQKECSRLKSIKTVLFHYILHYEAIKELLVYIYAQCDPSMAFLNRSQCHLLFDFVFELSHEWQSVKRRKQDILHMLRTVLHPKGNSLRQTQRSVVTTSATVCPGFDCIYVVWQGKRLHLMSRCTLMNTKSCRVQEREDKHGISLCS